MKAMSPMKAYRSRTRDELGLSPSEWEDLLSFVDETGPRIDEVRRAEGIEAPSPYVTGRDATDRATEFNPGGWVGRYPGGVRVYPDKLSEDEYEHVLEAVAGWLEFWDVPTAAAVLPLLTAETVDRRSVLLGYSRALMAFTQEALAHRPPVEIEWETERGPEPHGPIDVRRTMRRRAEGSRDVAYDRLQFSVDHPLNLLLLRFHAELSSELAELADDSIVMTSTIDRHRRYHRGFVESEFPTEMLERSLGIEFSDPEVLRRTRRQSPTHLTELVTLWESYLQDQTLTVGFERQLTVGIKPIEKLYELWILATLIEILTDLVGADVATPDEDRRRFDIGPDLTLHYNLPLREFSRILAPTFDTYPGRPDYALSADGDVVWIGDAKFSPESNVGLESYQRLLSYAVDLMPAGGEATAAVVYVGDGDEATTARTGDYRVEQTPYRPNARRTQRSLLERQLRRCVPGVGSADGN